MPKKIRTAPKRRRAPERGAKARIGGPACGLCGKTGNLTKTPCCNNWICDDEDEYVIFSYARNSCFRNHTRYTLCAYHHNEEHKGDWRECKKCKADFKAELYAHYGTNEYNFVRLENPPEFESTRCANCNEVISLTEDGYSMRGGEYICMRCSGIDFSKLLSGFQ
ncbi:MAG: hypothetical protein J2P21_11880 [Chloracidobacterium sp.]|nr:hypothetical protein [Chloracidobacterium sp.]